MADGGEGVERASGEPRLPEIQLKWSDFMWSLEKVRHKPYGKTTRERDWFRVNPLEMILLGMQTFNGEPAKKDHGTMLLVMESLKDEMTLRPRYWYRLLEVLSVTIQGGKDVPPVILQRCISSLMSLWKTLRNFPEFQPSVYAKSIAQFKLIDSLEETLSCLGKLLGVTLCLELQQFLDDLKHLVSSSLELHKSIVETDGGSDMECVVHNICSGREKISLQLSVHIYLMKDMQKCFNEGSTYFCQSLSNSKKLVSTVREFGDDCCLAQLLSIFQLLAVRCDELEILQDAEQPSSPDMTEEERVEKEPTDTEKTLCYISPVSELFDSLNSSLIQWKTLSASHSHSLCGVTEKLLTFAHLILSRTTLNISLPETVSFFREPIMLLMTYSTEGYLSDSPSEFFMELLEYMSSLVEQGTSPLKAVQTNLPNLFGPAFGVRNHMTSCKLLQYGYLAVCSQHQKSLLTEGLGFLMKVFHLFPPINELKAKEIAMKLRIDALEASSFILEELITFLPLEGDLLTQAAISNGVGDGGSPVGDGGSPVGDGGSPVGDRGSPVGEGGSPVGDRGSSVGDGGSPVGDGGSSVGDGGSPVGDGGSPVGDGGSPVGDRGSPVGDRGCSPVGDGGSPVGEGGSPVGDGVSPVGDRGSPVGDRGCSPVGDGGSLVSDRGLIGQEADWFDFREEEIVTKEERVADRAIRLRILLYLLRLACAMIQNGENIAYLFSTSLPKLFVTSPPAEPLPFNKKKLLKFFGEEPPLLGNGIPWNVDIKKFTVKILELGTLCLENNAISPFHFYGVIIPKLIKNIDTLQFSDEEKLSLTFEVLKITEEMLEGGHDIEHFITYGIDLITQLSPLSASSDNMKEFIGQMASHFVSSNQGSLLFLIKSACSFMISAFMDEVNEIRDFFKTLLFRGKRDEIRCVFKVCNKQLTEDHYSALRKHLYAYSSGKLNHRQLIALCELMITVMDMSKPHKIIREVTSNLEEEDETTAKEREGIETAVLTKLTIPCLEQVKDAIRNNMFKRDMWESVSLQLSRIALFRTLFQSEFSRFKEYSNMELLAVFQSKFPPDVVLSDDMMRLLAHSATRIEHVQTPRYDSLKVLLSRILRHFLTLDIEPDEPISDHGNKYTNKFQDSLLVRMDRLQRYLGEFPRNLEDKKRLLECGYSANLWKQRLSLSVKTDGTLSLEENMRQNLLACYTEFADILKQMAITHVSVDGEMVKVVDLFTDEISLTDLKGRRAIAVRMIDQRRGGGAMEGHFYERKAALLAKEDQIESEFDKMAKAAIKPKTFTVALNTEFFDCAKCCGPKIIGCYAPTGEHCERPLEIGLRYDSAIASIYDETGMEIENAELLFTEEGAFIFKSYTNGHPYDTSQVWLHLFTALLKEEVEEEEGTIHPSLVPALIIPKGYPNQQTWKALRRIHSPELIGSLLTCRPDFSPEWRSYYDHRPERVHIGTDMILHCGFTMNTDQSRPVLQRQHSVFTKDLAGLIYEDTMQQILSDEWLKEFRFLGKVVSQYISVCITRGKGERSLFDAGFDYERWKKTYSKTKQPPPVPEVLVTGQSPLPSKEAIVCHLLSFLDQSILGWCSSVDLINFCSSNHRQLLELKCFLERAQGVFKQPELLQKLKSILSKCVVVVPLLSLPYPLQEEIIHWVFSNEDRVWRYRGGRSGHETLQQFMNFLGQPFVSKSSLLTTWEEEEQRMIRRTQAYAGVVAFCLPYLARVDGDKFDHTNLQIHQMISYAVGEVLIPEEEEEKEEEKEKEEEDGTMEERWRPQKSDTCYEIVTAWVHPNYRGLSLSVNMYLMIIQQAPAHLVMCDMLQGSVERVVASSWILKLLERMGLRKYILQCRQRSYTVTTQTGATEQFEQVVINTQPLKLALGMYKNTSWANTTMLVVAAATAMPIMFYLMLKFKK